MGNWQRRCEWQGCHEWAERHLTLSWPGNDRITMLVCDGHFEVAMDHLRAHAPIAERQGLRVFVQRNVSEL